MHRLAGHEHLDLPETDERIGELDLFHQAGPPEFPGQSEVPGIRAGFRHRMASAAGRGWVRADGRGPEYAVRASLVFQPGPTSLLLSSCLAAMPKASGPAMPATGAAPVSLHRRRSGRSRRGCRPLADAGPATGTQLGQVRACCGALWWARCGFEGAAGAWPSWPGARELGTTSSLGYDLSGAGASKCRGCREAQGTGPTAIDLHLQTHLTGWLWPIYAGQRSLRTGAGSSCCGFSGAAAENQGGLGHWLSNRRCSTSPRGLGNEMV